MRAPCLAFLCLLALVLVGCGGDDELDHGLETEPLDSDPRGPALPITFDVRDGMAWKATLEIHTSGQEQGRLNGKAHNKRVDMHATAVHTWSVHRAGASAPARSQVTWKYTSAVGDGTRRLLDAPTVTGVFQHDEDGRPLHHTLQVNGGSKQEQLVVLDLIGSLLLAGYGGSPSWLPKKPVRVGEAWRLHDIATLRATASMRGRAEQMGVRAPDPEFQGSVRLHKVTEAGLLVLEIDALIDLKGTIAQGSKTGEMALGNRFQGRATVDPATGVPVSFDVTHTSRIHVRSAGDEVRGSGRANVRGTVERTSGAR